MKLDGKSGKAYGSLLMDLHQHGAMDVPVDGLSFKPAKRLEKLGIVTITDSDYKSPTERWKDSQYVRVSLVENQKHRITF